MHSPAAHTPPATIIPSDAALIAAANAWILNPKSHSLAALIPDPPPPSGGAQRVPVGPVSPEVHQAVERITGRPFLGPALDAPGTHATPNTANARSALKRSAALKESLLRS